LVCHFFEIGGDQEKSGQVSLFPLPAIEDFLDSTEKVRFKAVFQDDPVCHQLVISDSGRGIAAQVPMPCRKPIKSDCLFVKDH